MDNSSLVTVENGSGCICNECVNECICYLYSEEKTECPYVYRGTKK